VVVETALAGPILAIGVSQVPPAFQVVVLNDGEVGASTL